MTNLNDYYQKIKANTESRSGDGSGFRWRRVVLAICALAVLVVTGLLFTAYPLEIIILLLFMATVFFMERR